MERALVKPYFRLDDFVPCRHNVFAEYHQVERWTHCASSPALRAPQPIQFAAFYWKGSWRGSQPPSPQRAISYLVSVCHVLSRLSRKLGSLILSLERVLSQVHRCLPQVCDRLQSWPLRHRTVDSARRSCGRFTSVIEVCPHRPSTSPACTHHLHFQAQRLRHQQVVTSWSPHTWHLLRQRRGAPGLPGRLRRAGRLPRSSPSLGEMTLAVCCRSLADWARAVTPLAGSSATGPSVVVTQRGMVTNRFRAWRLFPFLKSV